MLTRAVLVTGIFLPTRRLLKVGRTRWPEGVHSTPPTVRAHQPPHTARLTMGVHQLMRDMALGILKLAYFDVLDASTLSQDSN